MSGSVILRLEGLTKKFGGFVALDNISLDIQDGEFLAVVGPSGSGKTTLIRLLAGMEELTSGAIFLRDQRIDQMPSNKRPTCMVFQSLALFPHRSVGQNIEFPLKVRGVPAPDRRRRAEELLDFLRLPQAYYDKAIAACSGGERQRVALARALAFGPEILFFDEPLSALDYRLRKTLEKELRELHQRTGKTFVYITHSLEEAMIMSDRIAIMRTGRFEQIGNGEEIYMRPCSRFVAEFMGEVNIFSVEGGSGGLRLLEGGMREVGGSSAPRWDLTPGDRGGLIVRPEFVRFLDAAATDSLKEGGFTLRGYVRSEYSFGSRIQYEVEAADGKKILLEKLRENRFTGAPGEEVVIGWDASDTHLIRETDIPA